MAAGRGTTGCAVATITAATTNGVTFISRTVVMVARRSTPPTPPSHKMANIRENKQVMRGALLMLLTVVLTSCVSCASSPKAQTKAQRKPLEKQSREYKTPTNYEPRYRGYNPKTGKLLTYDHKPRVELLDDKSGKYAFKWIGYDGKEKSLIFQRGDMIDLIVKANAVRTTSGEYVYTYDIENLASSGSCLSVWAVQNFGADVRPDKTGPMIPLNISSSIYKFREGHWISYNDASDTLQIDPSQSIKVQLLSSAPPGVVECAAAGGPLTLGGADEDLPLALDILIPGYEEWPHGYTIGPVDKLKTLSAQERNAYLLENLAQFRKWGWITDEVFKQYEEHLKIGDLGAILSRIDEDLKTEQITSEVFAIIQAMR